MELLDDQVAVLHQTRSVLLFRHVEDSVAKCLPELDAASCDLMGEFAEFPANCWDASSVGTFPFSVIDTTGGADKLVDAERGRSLLRDHDAG